MVPEDLVTVADYRNEQEATLAQSALDREGIRSFLTGAETLSTFWIAGTALGGVKLQVSAADVEKAHAILKEVQDQKPHQPNHNWICSRCGEQVEADFEVCWSCGASFDERTEAIPPDSIPTDRNKEDEFEEEAEQESNQLDQQATEEMAGRAFRAAVYGIGFFPLLFFSLALLVKLAGQELSPSALKKYYAATGILLFMLFALMGFILFATSG